MTIEEIRNQVREIEPDIMLLSTEYINNKLPLEFKCKCGKIFYKNWSTIQTHNSCLCRSCARKMGWKNKRREPDFDKELQNEFIRNGFIPLELVNNSRDKILCKDLDGYKGYINYHNAKQGKHFSVFSLKFNRDNLLYNLINYSIINKTGVKIIDFEESERSCETILFCQCPCGEYFTSSLGDFTTQKHWRCSKCSKSQSKLEILTENEIQKYTDNYIKQKRFNDCRNIKTNYLMPFDFYLPKLNLCIEVDGEQHFKPSKFSNISEEEASQNLEARKEKDRQKDEYCLKNGIKLLRISYKSFYRQNKEYQEIIKNLFT